MPKIGASGLVNRHNDFAVFQRLNMLPGPFELAGATGQRQGDSMPRSAPMAMRSRIPPVERRQAGTVWC